MIPVLDARAMRAADAETIRGGISSEDLMESAARALCHSLRRASPSPATGAPAAQMFVPT